MIYDKWIEFENLLKCADWNYHKADRMVDFEKGRRQIDRVLQLKIELEKEDGERVLELIHECAGGNL
jgi:hypothetical protein